MAQHAGPYIETYDPQMLGHVFSLGSLYLYSKWIDALTHKKMCMAFLCCGALFIEHFLIAVPITFAITLFVTKRNDFVIFAFGGTAVLIMLTIGSWMHGGKIFLQLFGIRPPCINRKNESRDTQGFSFSTAAPEYLRT